MQKKDFTKKDSDTSRATFTIQHDGPLLQITMNRSARRVSVDGLIAIKTCANASLKYYKYQDIEAEVETTMEQWMTKTRCDDCEQLGSGNQKTNGRDDYA